ncbi:MAG: MFS transporter, partial [Gemmatimonadetes bacterium]|nr:MFS transporter [Gemmatimonadota bacterium]
LLPSITSRFGLDGIASGALVSLLPLGILTGSLVFGPVVDRFGYRTLLTASAVLVVAGLEAMAFAPTVSVLQLAILAVGFGGGILNGGTNALVADISAGERGAKLSLLGVFFGVGALGMPALLGTLRGVEQSAVLGGIGAALVVPVLCIGVIAYPVPKQAQGFPVAEGAELLRDGALMAIALTLALQSGVEGIVNNWTTTYLQSSRGITPGDALLALTAYVVGMTVARLVLAAVLQRLPGGRVLVVGLLLTGAGVGVVAAAHSASAAAIGLALIGAGLSVGFPLLIGYVVDLFPTISGTAISVVLVIALSGNMALNYLVGVLSDWAGVGALPVYLVVCVALELTLALIALRAYHRRSAAA